MVSSFHLLNWLIILNWKCIKFYYHHLCFTGISYWSDYNPSRDLYYESLNKYFKAEQYHITNTMNQNQQLLQHQVYHISWWARAITNQTTNKTGDSDVENVASCISGKNLYTIMRNWSVARSPSFNASIVNIDQS
jgi:hypothetical protein